MRLCSFLILFSLCQTAFSRIGETIDECKIRYGQSVGTLKDQTQFRKNGIDIFISFYQGKASCIRYSGNITYAMVEELLKANGGEKKWLASLDDKSVKIWKTDDKELEATYAYATREDVDHLIILSRPLVRAEHEAQKEGEKKKVSGF